MLPVIAIVPLKCLNLKERGSTGPKIVIRVLKIPQPVMVALGKLSTHNLSGVDE